MPLRALIDEKETVSINLTGVEWDKLKSEIKAKKSYNTVAVL